MATKPVPKPRRRKVYASAEDTEETPEPPPQSGDFIVPAQPSREHLDLGSTPHHSIMRKYDDAPRPNEKQVRNESKLPYRKYYKPGDAVKHTLRFYEEKLTAVLLKNATQTLLTLTKKAHESGLISHIIRRHLESLDPGVPYPLMCRYLLLHVQKGTNSQGKMIDWLELLSTVEVPSILLSLMGQHYDSLVSMGEEGGHRKKVVFKEFEVPSLTEILAGHSSKWEVIAISLGLPDNKIKNIASMNVSKPVEVALNEVLLSWVRGEFQHAKPPTLGNLQEALRSDTVGLGALANKLEIDDSQRVKHSQKEDSPEEFGIVDHTKHVDVTEGNHALLEVQISGNHETSFTWTHPGTDSDVLNDTLQTHSDVFCNILENSHSTRISNVTLHGAILCILADDITSEGYYKCKVLCTEGGKTQHLCTEPILVTVHTPIDQYTRFLVDRYIRSPEIQSEWPPASTNSFINLALIKQDSIHKAGKYGHCTIRGDMDDIFKDKEGITYDKAFGGLSSRKCLLIEGRPGSGKTTLVHKFSQDWAKKEVTIAHVRLLFLIHLRGFCSDPNIGLSDLIGCYFSGSDVEVIGKYANKHHGLGLCFVLDGLDEYMPQRKNTYIYELIRRRVLPKSVVIVASRPAAAADFRRGATRQIEVLGFLRDQIYDYIEKYSFSKSHTGLIKYLDEHPNVLHMCYLPIHTCMVCFLYDNLESDLPQTETSIYAEFTKFTMLRMLYRDESTSDICIESLTDLPEPQNHLYNTICKLAFKMTLYSKQVMGQTEVKQFLKLQPTDKDCMGLITIDKKAMMCGFQKLYTFLHLTFQEFLAAFYISSLDEEKQLELIEQFREAIQMKQVWKFYCGLVPFTSTVIRLISQSCHGTPFKVQCSFESQQSCTCDNVVDKNSLKFRNHFFTSSDFTAIAYVISNAQRQCVRKVVFDKCTIGMEGVEILAQKACGKLSSITILCYHGYECVTEQLSVVNRLIHTLPCLDILDVSNTNLGRAEIDALTGNLNHPNLQILKVGSGGNLLYSSQDLPLVIAERFSSSCSKLVNVCFSGNDRACFPSSLPLSFYFSCGLPELNMCFCKLRPIELQVLSDDLMHSHNCIELYLTGCGIDDDTVSILAHGLTHCTNLEILDLSCNRIGDIGAVSLAEGIKLARKLEKLNLSLNNISDVGALAVVNATKCLVYLCGNSITNTNDILQHVSNVDFHTFTFSACDIRDSDLFIEESRIDSKAPCEQCYSGVHVLAISSNYISYHGAIALSSCLKYFPYLEELHISSNADRGIGAQGTIAIASALSGNLHKGNNTKAINLAKSLANPLNFVKLDISYNHIGYEGCKAISGVLNHCTHLEELNISGNDIGDDGACVLVSIFFHYAQCLLKLNISYNSIRRDGANAIADALKHCTHLEELNISCNHIGGDGACVLARSFCHYAQCLLKLNVSYNNIGCDGANAIADALKHCTHLEELNISGVGGGACIVRSFSHNAQCLLKLDISHNNIRSDHVVAIADALKYYTHLEELNISHIGGGACTIVTSFSHYAQCLLKLDISHNNIRSDHVVAIADALKYYTHLEELNISGIGGGACTIVTSFSHYAQCLLKLDISQNNIRSDHVVAIADALKYYTHLEELNISGIGAGDDEVCTIVRSCSCHLQSLYTLDMSKNHIGSEGCRAMAESLENLRVLVLSYNLIHCDSIDLYRALRHCTVINKS